MWLALAVYHHHSETPMFKRLTPLVACVAAAGLVSFSHIALSQEAGGAGTGAGNGAQSNGSANSATTPAGTDKSSGSMSGANSGANGMSGKAKSAVLKVALQPT
jgi:hypothetical protein